MAKKKKWVDVAYHTGFYRFTKLHSKAVSFKIEGTPCLVQDGTKDFVFFCDTNLLTIPEVIPVKKIF